MKINISKQVFINNFVTQCCSQWVIDNYSYCCNHGAQEMLSKPPLEDIYFCAEQIWEKLEKDNETN